MYDCDDKINELADAIEKIAKSLRRLHHRRKTIDSESHNEMKTMDDIIKKMEEIKERKGA